MLNTILGSKKDMSQAFVGGVRTPVTNIQAGPCVVTQVRPHKAQGYWSIQLGFGERKTKNITKSMQGHLKGATTGKMAPRFIREIKVTSEPELKVGDKIIISDIFSKGDIVAVTGVSKGKGFAGVVKRWGFAGGPRTHGQSDRQRSPGSIGQGTTPGRVRKGKKMPGRMGTQKTKVGNLLVVDINSELNMISVSGPVPGGRNNLLIIEKIKAGKKVKASQKEESKKKAPKKDKKEEVQTTKTKEVKKETK